MQEISCENCEKKFKDYPSNNRKYCSKACGYKSFEVNHNHSCEWCGVHFTNKIATSKFCGSSCAGSHAVTFVKNHKGGSPFGVMHWNWKGGNKRGNRGSGQRRFRKAVLNRDNYTCVLCNSKDKKLVADHIKPWAEYPELREDINNGRTLCIDCNYKETYIIKNWQVQRG